MDIVNFCLRMSSYIIIQESLQGGYRERPGGILHGEASALCSGIPGEYLHTFFLTFAFQNFRSVQPQRKPSLP